MPNTSQDTEITLGTGRMLALFFALVVICAAFFAIGFSLGRKASAIGSGNVLAAQSGAPSSVIRPPAGKNNPTPTPASTDFSFYNAVGQKTAESKLTPPSETQKKASSSSDTQAQPGASTNSDQSKSDQSKTDQPKSDQPANVGDLGGTSNNAYYVQVAAVTRQEDADALVEALKKKQYPAFSNNNPAVDKYFRVQVGPFTDLKDAEGIRIRLISDGYNPILRK